MIPGRKCALAFTTTLSQAYSATWTPPKESYRHHAGGRLGCADRIRIARVANHADDPSPRSAMVEEVTVQMENSFVWSVDGRHLNSLQYRGGPGRRLLIRWQRRHPAIGERRGDLNVEIAGRQILRQLEVHLI